MSSSGYDYLKEAGAAGIGGRLRRLSERLDADARRIYATTGITFEQRWLGLLDLLSGGPKSVGELASALGVSHPSVSQSRASLEAAGLIEWQTDQTDRRRRRLRLSPAGEALVAQLRPLWRVLDEVAVDLDAEALGAAAALGRLEAALERLSFERRVLDRLATIGAFADRAAD